MNSRADTYSWIAAITLLATAGCARSHLASGTEPDSGAGGRLDGGGAPGDSGGGGWLDGGGAPGDGSLDGGRRRDGAAIIRGTYHPCLPFEECEVPGDACREYSVRDDVDRRRSSRHCSPACTQDEECPPLDGMAGACIAGVCFAPCTPGAPGACWGTQECVAIEGETRCLPQER